MSLLPRHVPAALRPDLVFQHDAGQARLLERPHGEEDVDGVAVSGVRVPDQEQVRARRDRPRAFQVLGETHEADIGPPEPVFRKPGAGKKRRRKPRAPHEPGAEAVEHPRQRENLRRADQLLESMAHARHRLVSSRARRTAR